MQQADLPQRVSVGNKTVRIQQRLGKGAFGVVYKVKDEASYEVYALKDVLCLNASALRNALRQASALSQILHKNLITIVVPDELLYSKSLHMLLLTGYCPGGSLNDRLARSSSDETNVKWISQTVAALAHLHSREVVHRNLKADNVLLTATEDVKLADFGLVREYTELRLKPTSIRQDESSWITSYAQYYLNSGTGPIHWMAPEFFSGHYTENADVFSLGLLFFAVLERDFIAVDGKTIYGTFVENPTEGKVGLGFAMEKLGRHIKIAFSSYAQGSMALQRVVLETLQYDADDRPSAQEVYDKVMNICQGIKLHQEPSPETAWCC